MISSVTMIDYYKLAVMNQSINRFINEAYIEKSQINNSIALTLFKDNNIGNKVDVFA
jgi:hypothetical protein